MSAGAEAYLPVINQLVADIEPHEAKLAEMKRMVNTLCGYAGLPARYANVETGARNSNIASLKSDQFYGKPQATAVREYLDMRGAPSAGGLGAASVREIFEALKAGGFAFDTKNEDNAMRGLRISLAKNSTTFHRLPNGQFGLLLWYPKVPRSSVVAETVEARMTASDASGNNGKDDKAADAAENVRRLAIRASTVSRSQHSTVGGTPEKGGCAVWHTARKSPGLLP